MYLHELPERTGSKKKRVGRGPGSGNGKTCGRGHKGAKSRSGYRKKRGFEGGQTPLNRRLPKFGFKNPNTVVFQIVNLGSLERDHRIVADLSLDKILLKELGFIKSLKRPVKLLSNGSLSKKIIINVDAASRQAVSVVSQQGGEVVIGE